MTIGERIKIIRGTMSQADFAEMTKLNKATLSRYERDANVPDANAIVRICAACKISSEWLLTGAGEPSKNAKPIAETHDSDGSKTIIINKLEYNRHILEAISQAFGEIVKEQEVYLQREKFQMLVYIIYEEFVSAAMDYIPTIRGSFEKQIIRKNKVISTLIKKLREYDERIEKKYQAKMDQEIYFDGYDDDAYLNSMTYEQADRIAREEYLQDEIEKLETYNTDKKMS